jgi:ATP-dependent DNA helicase RecG
MKISTNNLYFDECLSIDTQGLTRRRGGAEVFSIKHFVDANKMIELGSGVINIHKYLPTYANGAQPLFEDTPEGFRLTLPLRLMSDDNLEARGGAPQVPPQLTPQDPATTAGQIDEQVSEQVGEQVSEQVQAMLRAVEEGPRSKRELLEAAGLASAYLNYKRHVLPMLEQELIEGTIPDKPNSRLPKYRLTEKGRSLLS